MFRRRFTAALDDDRCKADIATGKIAKEGAQCMRAKKIGDYCKQHARCPHCLKVLQNGPSSLALHHQLTLCGNYNAR